MPKNLVIVESPAKAKTIARYLGKDYEVKSSFGHIRDLPKKDIGVDIESGFQPTYQISPGKEDVVKELKKASKNAVVWLASDEDREGEAIAWHVCNALGLKPSETKRIVFHEITEPAIKAALKNPRAVDEKLVNAQQARRVLDRLVGYELSPVLWKKVRAGLSAGRVQSVAVRLIVEREREISSFSAESSFKVTAEFKAGKSNLPAELSQKINDYQEVKKFIGAAAKAEFKIVAIENKPGSRSPSAPFTTSTLQQEASRRLGYGVRQTMTLAQKLYENGHITYMRTDSTNLAGTAISAAAAYIKQNYGEDYATTRQFKTKNASAQEAHEAIRPTNINALSAGADNSQKKLYELIWKRTLSSQMAPAKIEKTEVSISITGDNRQFIARGEVLVFDGFMKVYGGSKEDVILPELKNGDTLDLQSLMALETFSRPPARYSEASLVKKLEELGIGRPSTYAPTIGTIQDRQYIEKTDLEGTEKELRKLVLNRGAEVEESTESITVGADKNKLLPTELAAVVTDFLVKYFPDIFEYEFTARAEEQLDAIAEGKLEWQKMLESFYERFHPLVKKSESASREEASQARKLGDDPNTGLPIIVRFGRFGPVLQLGETPEKDDKTAAKPRFAPLPAGTKMENITLDQALPMFQLPRVVGKTADGEEITADIGRFGPYVKVGKSYTSIKGYDPLTISEADAIKLIADKTKAAAERIINDFGKIKVLRGPYGPYITDGKKNARIPKSIKAEDLTEAEANELIEKAPTRTKKRRRKQA